METHADRIAQLMGSFRLALHAHVDERCSALEAELCELAAEKDAPSRLRKRAHQGEEDEDSFIVYDEDWEEEEAEGGVDDHGDDEDGAIVNLGLRTASPADAAAWQHVKTLPLAEQKKNPWFSRRWGFQLSQIRAGLGRETARGTRPLWDELAEAPADFSFENMPAEYETCAFCGETRRCTIEMTRGGADSHHPKTRYIGAACWRLVDTAHDFFTALCKARRGDDDDDVSLSEMDQLFAEVQDAHIRKVAGRYNKE